MTATTQALRKLKLDPKSLTPRYGQLMGGLRDQIRRGELESGQQLPDERSLARRLGVHRLTVHRAFHDLAREGWLERRPRHGTRVAEYVREFVLVLPTTGETPGETEFFDLQARGFLQRLEGGDTRGQLLHAPLKTGWVGDDPALVRLLETRRVHGVIFSALCPSEKLMARLQRLGMPYTHIHAAEGVANSVWIDYDHLRQLGIRWLLGQDCRQFGAICGTHPGQRDINRQAVEAALRGAGLAGETHPILVIEEPTMARGFAQGEEFLRAHPDLDGLFVTDDVLARGVCMALLKLGRQVPEQLKVVCHFNKGAHFTYPFPVARVEVDALAVVEAAIARIEKSLAGEHDQPSRQLIKPRLVVVS